MNHPPSLTLLLLTHNESENIKNNLSWINNYQKINEIIVVNDQSTDDTVNVIKNLTLPKTTKVKVFNRKLNGDFSSQRNFGIGESSNDWIFWLDPDEVPDQKLIEFLNSFNPNNNHPYSFRRLDMFFNHTLKYGETGDCHLIRLFNKKHGTFKGLVHETWQDEHSANKTNLTINHFSHPNLLSFFEKINFYTDIRARELFDKNTRTNLFQIIFYPSAKFFVNYFLKLGFLDGTPGIIMALSMSFHSFLVRSKLWHLWQK